MDLQAFIQIWQKRFLAATTVLTILLSCYVMLAKYEHGAEETIKSFRRLRSNVSQIRTATVEMNQVLAIYRGLRPTDYEKKTSEAILFDRVDDLKDMFPRSVFTIEPVKDLPESVSIPFTVKLSDYKHSSFLNDLGLMSAKIFPFVSIDGISISVEGETKEESTIQKLKASLGSAAGDASDRKNVVTYTIQGTVTAPKKPAGAGTQ